MSQRDHRRNCAVHVLARALAFVAVLAWAGAASAYVVVTVDNQVYEVETKPEVRGSLVMFTLDGAPVSLRVYEVNIAQTNQINALIDQGAGATRVLDVVRALRPASPVDDRLILSSRLHRASEGVEVHDRPYRVHHGPNPDASTSFDSSARGSSRAASSSAVDPSQRQSAFAAEARRAMDEAERRVAEPSRARAGDDGRGSDRLAEVDAEIAAEQAYLRQLTSGEVATDNLDKAIEQSMDKVRRLQRRRDTLAARSDDAPAMRAAPAPAPMAAAPSGRYPAGSRESRWEQELGEAQARMARLRAQQGSLPPGASDEREVLDELIAEAEHDAARLQRRLDRAGEP